MTIGLFQPYPSRIKQMAFGLLPTTVSINPEVCVWRNICLEMPSLSNIAWLLLPGKNHCSSPIISTVLVHIAIGSSLLSWLASLLPQFCSLHAIVHPAASEIAKKVHFTSFLWWKYCQNPLPANCFQLLRKTRSHSHLSDAPPNCNGCFSLLTAQRSEGDTYILIIIISLHPLATD